MRMFENLVDDSDFKSRVKSKVDVIINRSKELKIIERPIHTVDKNENELWEGAQTQTKALVETSRIFSCFY